MTFTEFLARQVLAGRGSGGNNYVGYQYRVLPPRICLNTRSSFGSVTVWVDTATTRQLAYQSLLATEPSADCRQRQNRATRMTSFILTWHCSGTHHQLIVPNGALRGLSVVWHLFRAGFLTVNQNAGLCHQRLSLKQHHATFLRRQQLIGGCAIIQRIGQLPIYAPYRQA